MICLLLSFSPQDSKNAFGFEVCLSVREHLEARRFVSPQSAVYRTAGGTSARLVWKVRHYVAGAGQCL